MGMFDYVEYKSPCPVCGHVITEWQSKDGPCSLSMLQPKDIMGFGAFCPKCGTDVYMKVTARVVDVELGWFKRKGSDRYETGVVKDDDENN